MPATGLLDGSGAALIIDGAALLIDLKDVYGRKSSTAIAIRAVGGPTWPPPPGWPTATRELLATTPLPRRGRPAASRPKAD